MGLFDKLKKKEEPAVVSWEDAFPAATGFYEKPDGHYLGTVALIENTKTAFTKVRPTKPGEAPEKVNEWKVLLVSTTKQGVAGEMSFDSALEKLKAFALDETDLKILVKPLTLDDMLSLKD